MNAPNTGNTLSLNSLCINHATLNQSNQTILDRPKGHKHEHASHKHLVLTLLTLVN